MATSACLVATLPPPSNSISSSHKQHKPQFSSLPFSLHIPTTWNPHQIPRTQPITAFLGIGLFLVSTSSAFPASAAEIPILALQEPDNALSLPTWAIHVSSVVEWITAMVLVWEYGEKSGYHSWKGLSWGMVPLLGGAFCACTWHFFYNSESLEVLVALQASLTVIGNFTMCIAAFRIYKSMQGGSENP
ncbi:hypothetical protein MRB53_027009 [Persea americana]|uniref:Uncharacterized protein n=1 Tax=Persea americana TaxID=3435 RepID=A0ACC2LKH9_PERAE|nr:hypothetical protein MRB53_027009 [Persea americana]